VQARASRVETLSGGPVNRRGAACGNASGNVHRELQGGAVATRVFCCCDDQTTRLVEHHDSRRDVDAALRCRWKSHRELAEDPRQKSGHSRSGDLRHCCVEEERCRQEQGIKAVAESNGRYSSESRDGGAQHWCVEPGFECRCSVGSERPPRTRYRTIRTPASDCFRPHSLFSSTRRHSTPRPRRHSGRTECCCRSLRTVRSGARSHR
jgi:hypothetical protein